MSIKIIMSLMRSYFGVCLRANNKKQNFDENILKAPWKVMVCFRVLFEVNTVRQWLTMCMRLRNSLKPDLNTFAAIMKLSCLGKENDADSLPGLLSYN